MVRLKGGEWAPIRKYRTLAKAMEVAYEMAKFHGRKATVIQTLCSVEIIDDKPVWVDCKPTL